MLLLWWWFVSIAVMAAFSHEEGVSILVPNDTARDAWVSQQSGRVQFPAKVGVFETQAAAIASLGYLRPIMGELFESQTESVYMYSVPEPQLVLDENHGDERWQDVSDEKAQEFADASKCAHVKGRYAMVTPKILVKQGHPLVEFIRSVVPDLHAWDDFTMFSGCRGTSTAIHFDRGENHFVQLRGRKTFYLFPPDLLASFYLAPTGHVHCRQSMVVPRNLHLPVSIRKFPRIARGQGMVWTFTLDAGESLKIPPYWLHYVQSDSDDSLGMAIRDEFNTTCRDTIEKLPLPFESYWSIERNVRTMVRFIQELLGKDDKVRVLFERWQASVPHAMAVFKHISPESVNEEELDETKVVQYAHILLHEYRSCLEGSMPSEAVFDYLLMEYIDSCVLTIFPTSEQAVWFVTQMLPSLMENQQQAVCDG